jgi:membrane associated rhomboid family serine protease
MLTSILLHGNVLHLFFNLWVTWLFGSALERWMGSVRYFFFINLVGLGSSAAEFLASGPSIGLSGVGFAMFGILFALRRRYEFAARLMHRRNVYLIVGWFFLCIILTEFGNWGVGIVAHGVGASLGWLIGIAILTKRAKGWLAAITVGVLVLTLMPLYMPWDEHYLYFRVQRALERGHYAAARYWIGELARREPENEALPYFRDFLPEEEE